MNQTPIIRPVQPVDFNAWLPLFNGYNAFYGREGPTALAPSITQTTWERFCDPQHHAHRAHLLSARPVYGAGNRFYPAISKLGKCFFAKTQAVGISALRPYMRRVSDNLYKSAFMKLQKKYPISLAAKAIRGSILQAFDGPIYRTA